MKFKILSALAATLAVVLGGCASTSIKQSWKSPTHQGGAVQKVAVIAVDERGLVRQGFENRFARDFRARGQEAVVTHEMLGLPAIKANKEAAATRFRAAGADALLIVRLVDQVSYDRTIRATPSYFVDTLSGVDNYYGWYNYYSVAFTDMGTTWSTTRQTVYLESSCYELKSGQRLWSALTKTVIKDDEDRLVKADELVALVVNAMRKDGLVH